MSKRESPTLRFVELERKQGTHYRPTSILIRLDPIDVRTIRLPPRAPGRAPCSNISRESMHDACLDQFMLCLETPCTRALFPQNCQLS